MKQRIFLFLSIFIYFLLVFFIEKSAFFFIRIPDSELLTVNNYWSVVYHGLPLDFSMAGYLMLLPAFLILFSIWIDKKFITLLLNIYFAVILFVTTVIFVVDIILYPHWGFHFDANIFMYLKNPKEALASGTVSELLLGILLVIMMTVILYLGYLATIKKQTDRLNVPKSFTKSAIILLIMTAMLFIPIRGGFTVSTMNVGKVYFSDKMFLNHAAINPHFNFFYSYSKSENFASQYQFLSREQADSIFTSLNKVNMPNDTTKLFKTYRPNIVMFILESFSGNVMGCLGSEDGATPNIDRLAKEGILFRNYYSNSFRTDRGLVSILSGYPAQPTTAVIKYPQKTQSLPSIPRSLKNVGYDLSFYYGGDADFANLRSYLVGCCGIDKICSDKDFPLSQRMTKWGVPDAYVLQKASEDILSNKYKKPFFSLILTLSSHEPFDVPTDKYDVPFLNSIAYTDSCVGKFVDDLKASPLWDNTVVVMLADHPMQSYPPEMDNNEPLRFHIPLIVTGGAIKKPMIITDYGSQNDLPNTLLSQLSIEADSYRFSKNMLSKGTQKFAFYSYMNGFSMIDKSGSVIFDNDRNDVIRLTGDSSLVIKSKAFFQTMYNDLGER